MMEMVMKRMISMVALAIALIGAGQSALAQGVHTGSEENLRSGGSGEYYHSFDQGY
jgi:hypothetical protein